MVHGPINVQATCPLMNLAAHAGSLRQWTTWVIPLTSSTNDFWIAFYSLLRLLQQCKSALKSHESLRFKRALVLMKLVGGAFSCTQCRQDNAFSTTIDHTGVLFFQFLVFFFIFFPFLCFQLQIKYGVQVLMGWLTHWHKNHWSIKAQMGSLKSMVKFHEWFLWMSLPETEAAFWSATLSSADVTAAISN